ncbi:hypothetical protein HOB10_05515 [Candidatus Parcubacteria bacterium]|jgi:hypothetical protein|nr:hypothetical protein [Candidatus Parcubacteria bacterium]
MANEDRLVCKFDGQTALRSFLSNFDDGDDTFCLTHVSLEIDKATAVGILLKFFQRKKMAITADDLNTLQAGDLIPATEEVIAKTDGAWGMATSQLSNALTSKKLR